MTLQTSGDDRFFTVNGEHIESVLQLAQELEDMRDDIYIYHAEEDENDFANWVEHVFDEKELADELRDANDSDHAAHEIYKHLATYHT